MIKVKIDSDAVSELPAGARNVLIQPMEDLVTTVKRFEGEPVQEGEGDIYYRVAVTRADCSPLQCGDYVVLDGEPLNKAVFHGGFCRGCWTDTEMGKSAEAISKVQCLVRAPWVRSRMLENGGVVVPVSVLPKVQETAAGR